VALDLEDETLGALLLASEKDRAEHIMLVDLARNDVNRVCQPKTVQVDHLMRVQKFSHVIHLTSQISGKLREGLTRYFFHFLVLENFIDLPF
jgi:anthranilate synthase component 1